MSQLCYDNSKLYKPEWAYPDETIGKKKYRAESFVLPFSFTVLANGNPQYGYTWKLDDDMPWRFRAALFPQCGTGELINSPQYNTGNPMLVRIWDTYGNCLTNCIGPNGTNDFVLAVGAVGQSGFNSINASGFPWGLQIDCEPGGVITFDFQVPGSGSNVQVQGTMLGAKLFEEC